VQTKRYHLPGERHPYLPDPAEPIDRWFQAANASNARTTATIIRDLAPLATDLIIDPFAGGGSIAATARGIGVRFLGIELDPVLACVCVAKSRTTADHAGRFASYSCPRSPEDLAELIEAINGENPPNDALALSCLALLSYVRASTGVPLTPTEIATDIEVSKAPHSDNRVLQGDCTSAVSWSRVPSASHAVIYTSPPFGDVSPRLTVPAPVRELATEIIGASADPSAATGETSFGSYQDLTMGMLRQAIAHLNQATVIIEHEPADDGYDAREALVKEITTEFGDTVTAVRVLESKAFSWRGVFSLIACELRGGEPPRHDG
jgi:hypothetical protein